MALSSFFALIKMFMPGGGWRNGVSVNYHAHEKKNKFSFCPALTLHYFGFASLRPRYASARESSNKFGI
ncbi:MAG: hypothetical protein II338_07415, partial [Bacteroidaceae bacterium]|nr:hypothetical protein [Bacteroidaceae bacterium]